MYFLSTASHRVTNRGPDELRDELTVDEKADECCQQVLKKQTTENIKNGREKESEMFPQPHSQRDELTVVTTAADNRPRSIFHREAKICRHIESHASIGC